MIEKLHAILAGDQPIFFLLAGPHGAGKSTFRKKYLGPLGLLAIDPDQVAREIFGRDPLNTDEARAATIASTERLRRAFKTGNSIGLESVFSDTNGLKLNLIKESKSFGYKAGVIFIGLNDPQLSVARVVDRVEHGGHDVPDRLIYKRFPQCFQNLKAAIPISDFVLLVDNSGELRHRIFGSVTPIGGIELWDAAPNWYSSYNIGGTS